MHSPASVSLPVSPDDDNRFDRTVSPSPAFPKETPQQCGVSRVVEIHVPSPTTTGPTTRVFIKILEQAAALGYNVLNLTGAYAPGLNPTDSDPFLSNELEHLLTASHTLGYFNSVTTNGTHLHAPHSASILQNLDLVTIRIGGKPETHDRLFQQRGAFARMLEGIPIINNSVSSLGFTHTLRPDSWQILPWLTDFAIQHKATLLHLSTHTKKTWTPIDLHRIYLSAYYLKTFAEPELLIKLDLLHRDNIINNPNSFFHQDSMSEASVMGFSTLFNELVITWQGDILPLGHGCSDFFRIGNIHAKEPLSSMVGQFLEKKLDFVMQLLNETFSDILRDPATEILHLSEMVVQKTYEFQGA